MSSQVQSTTPQPPNLEEVASKMRQEIQVKDMTYHLTKYQKVFTGTDATKWLIDQKYANTEEDAELLGNGMMAMGFFHHVLDSEPFKNGNYFYRFHADEGHGAPAKKSDGSDLSWSDLIKKMVFRDNSEGKNEEMNPNVPERHKENIIAPVGPTHTNESVSPLDEHNIKLLDCVHPPQWVNPTYDGYYNLVAIGGGAGGLVATSAGAAVNAKVAMIERHLLGGDCLNVGCVPSKALIKCARLAHEAKNSAEYGITATSVKVDFGKVMERMRMLRAKIAPVDSAQTKTKKGVDVYIGNGIFLDDHTIQVTDDQGKIQILKFKKAVIATGGTASLPPIPGLLQCPYTTNATLYNLEVLPPRMVVIGAGPVGLEMAQAFQRFGSAVTVLVRGQRILSKEDPSAAHILKEQLTKDGVEFKFGVDFQEITHVPKGENKDFPEITVSYKQNGEVQKVVCEVLLIATGRKPNVEGIGLEAAGVEFDLVNGVKVNDKMQTTKANIFAVGDCCMKYQFTHVSGTQGYLAMRNALFFGNNKVSSMLIPWVTYTEPEIAHVGLYASDLDERGIQYETYQKNLDDVDRAILEGETEGFVKIHVKAGTDKILGATIVATNAGEMISEITVAMQNGVGLGGIGAAIHPYPTQAEAIKGAAGLYSLTKLTPTVKVLLGNLMTFARK
eukprot:c14418_g2_i1.p1 GENE.c14418_g2_i1~~c14418_g2_i1.p1  ORF type:complete len:678 (-),score=342.32 c14418_g2_i1:21-2033(-)